MATSKKLTALQNQLTNLALQVAKNFGIKLDFSNESIKSVEKILDKIHKDYKKTKNEDGLEGIALEFCAYIITVIERNFESGEWQRNHPNFGKDTYPYYWKKGSTIFPNSWCLKRIIDGEGDNVWSKYKAIVLNKVESSNITNQEPPELWMK